MRASRCRLSAPSSEYGGDEDDDGDCECCETSHASDTACEYDQVMIVVSMTVAVNVAIAMVMSCRSAV